jgi:hypothetical protein
MSISQAILGGPYNGYSSRQTINNYKDSNQIMTRSICIFGTLQPPMTDLM